MVCMIEIFLCHDFSARFVSSGMLNSTNSTQLATLRLSKTIKTIGFYCVNWHLFILYVKHVYLLLKSVVSV